MNIKKNLLPIYLGMSSIFSAYSTTANILKFSNNSSEKVNLCSVDRTIEISAGATKKMFVSIPYNELQKNLFDFVLDRPYIPAQALSIVTKEGTFYLWQDHRGIVVAKAFKLGMSREEALPSILMALSKADRARLVGCLVVIDPQGIPLASRA